jgi:ribose 5-phosphate isomerase A
MRGWRGTLKRFRERAPGPPQATYRCRYYFLCVLMGEDRTGLKRERAAASAVSLVTDGMVLGLGTGSTAERAIRLIGLRLQSERLELVGVPTSYRTEQLAIACGIPLTTLSAHPVLDLSIDGADQVDPHLAVLKGGWGSHTREKIVAYAANRRIICVDDGKLVPELSKPVPLEVLPYAVKVVERQVRELGGTPVVRLDGTRGGYFITEHGNLIVDADFGAIHDPETLSRALSAVVGAVEHGLFMNVSEVHVGAERAVKILKKA